MSTNRFYEDQDQPWIRSNLEGYPCPACGETLLLQSTMDVPGDNRDIEIYCDNMECEAREIRIVIMRTSSPEPRADVAALQAVDEGTGEERLPDTIDALSMYDNAMILNHVAGTLGRRSRRIAIEIKPAD